MHSDCAVLLHLRVAFDPTRLNVGAILSDSDLSTLGRHLARTGIRGYL